MSKEKETVVVSFAISNDVLKTVEDHIDKTKIKLRGRGVKFSKKQMFGYLCETGLKNFDLAEFERSVNV